MLLIPSFAAAACAVFGLAIGEASRRVARVARDWCSDSSWCGLGFL